MPAFVDFGIIFVSKTDIGRQEQTHKTMPNKNTAEFPCPTVSPCRDIYADKYIDVPNTGIIINGKLASIPVVMHAKPANRAVAEVTSCLLYPAATSREGLTAKIEATVTNPNMPQYISCWAVLPRSSILKNNSNNVRNPGSSLNSSYRSEKECSRSASLAKASEGYDERCGALGRWKWGSFMMFIISLCSFVLSFFRSFSHSFWYLLLVVWVFEVCEKECNSFAFCWDLEIKLTTHYPRKTSHLEFRNTQHQGSSHISMWFATFALLEKSYWQWKHRSQTSSWIMSSMLVTTTQSCQSNQVSDSICK